MEIKVRKIRHLKEHEEYIRPRNTGLKKNPNHNFGQLGGVLATPIDMSTTKKNS